MKKNAQITNNPDLSFKKSTFSSKPRTNNSKFANSSQEILSELLQKKKKSVTNPRSATSSVSPQNFEKRKCSFPLSSTFGDTASTNILHQSKKSKLHSIRRPGKNMGKIVFLSSDPMNEGKNNFGDINLCDSNVCLPLQKVSRMEIIWKHHKKGKIYNRTNKCTQF